jgi:hypothetical protein
MTVLCRCVQSIRAELSLFQSRVHDYREDLQKIESDMKLIKVAYFQLKQEQTRASGALSARGGSLSRPESQTGGGPLPPLGSTIGGAGYDTAIEDLKQQQIIQAAAHAQLLETLQSNTPNAASHSAAASAAAIASFTSMINNSTTDATAATAATVTSTAVDSHPTKPTTAATGTADEAFAKSSPLPPLTPSKGDMLRKGAGGTPRGTSASGTRPPQ